MRAISAKHTEVILEHIPRTYRNHRTTIRVFPDEWQTFKETCHQYGLTTCYVLRCFIHKWLDDVRRKSDIPKLKMLKGTRVYDDTNIKKERWIDSRMTMTLYDPRHLQGRLRTKQRERLEKQSRVGKIV